MCITLDGFFIWIFYMCITLDGFFYMDVCVSLLMAFLFVFLNFLYVYHS